MSVFGLAVLVSVVWIVLSAWAGRRPLERSSVWDVDRHAFMRSRDQAEVTAAVRADAARMRRELRRELDRLP